ncbi:MAG: hypothetical protein VX071_01360, partial [Candidatus Thermoplasmatota archaeon]|nr:hypothetical protein [Candidatus Thermoplasmatota archaeon]
QTSGCCSGLKAIGDTLFFRYDDGTHGSEMWRSDGTLAGTEIVDVCEGHCHSQAIYYTAVGNTIYFLASFPGYGIELGAYDPTNITFDSDETSCEQDSIGCSWLDDTSTCVASCSASYDDETSCDADSLCRWNSNDNCVEACSIEYDSQGDCNGDDECIWLDSSNECVRICADSNSFVPYANDKVASGIEFTCAILDNGDMKCWGWNGYGTLGYGSDINPGLNAPPSTPIDLGTGRTAVAVSAGEFHTCAVLDNGDLKCWGWDNHGQLGDGERDFSNRYVPSSTPIDLGTGRTAVAVSADGSYTCAILDNGDLKCWGENNLGQLGTGGIISDGSYKATPSPPIDLATGRTAVAVS